MYTRVSNIDTLRVKNNMDSIVINGGKKLQGTISISGAKNSCLPIMVTSILCDGVLSLSNVPKLSDINTMKQLLLNHGTKIQSFEEGESLTLKLDSSNLNNFTAPYEIVKKMRASIWVLGALLAKYGEAKVSLPGGCAIGARQVDLHIESLKALGADLILKDGYIVAKTNGRLRGAGFTFTKKSVGATINAILASTLAEGESNFYGCAVEPEIVDLCNCLLSMGAKIKGIGTEHVSVIGVDELRDAEHAIIPDRIEAGTYMIASAITGGDITITNIDPTIVSNLSTCLVEAGVEIEERHNTIRVKSKDNLHPVNVSTAPYPGFATDLQAQFMALMTLSSGESIIEENIFENRYMHVPELCRMGANITVDGKKAVITGVEHLSGAEVMASDLRASVSLILAALAAKGETKIRRVYHLDRGYQSIEQKLANCGADIKRIYGDTL